MTSNASESSKAGTERLMLEAILDGEGKAWREYFSALPGERALRTLSIATSAAVFRKWPEDPTLQMIVDYVAEIDNRFPTDLPVPRVVVESVIRSIFGESELIDETPGEEVIGAELLIVKSIGFDVLASEAERNAYLTEVLEAVG